MKLVPKQQCCRCILCVLPGNEVIKIGNTQKWRAIRHVSVYSPHVVRV